MGTPATSISIHSSFSWYSLAQLLMDTSTPKTSSEIRSEATLFLAFQLKNLVLKNLNTYLYDSMVLTRDHPFKTSAFLGGRGHKLAKFADG